MAQRRTTRIPGTKWFSAKALPTKIRAELAERGIEVKRVRDATKDLELNVRAEDVRRGRRKDPLGCAGALCAIRQEKVDAAVIRVRAAYMVRGSDAIRYTVPATVRQQLVLFDRAGQFEPGVYVLHPPSPTQRLGNDKRRKRATGPKKTTRKDRAVVIRNVTAGVRW